MSETSTSINDTLTTPSAQITTSSNLINTQIYKYGGDIAFAVINGIILAICVIIILHRVTFALYTEIDESEAHTYFYIFFIMLVLLTVLLIFSAISYSNSKNNLKSNSTENSVKEKDIYRIFTILNSIIFVLSLIGFLNARAYK